MEHALDRKSLKAVLAGVSLTSSLMCDARSMGFEELTDCGWLTFSTFFYIIFFLLSRTSGNGVSMLCACVHKYMIKMRFIHVCLPACLAGCVCVEYTLSYCYADDACWCALLLSGIEFLIIMYGCCCDKKWIWWRWK